MGYVRMEDRSGLVVRGVMALAGGLVVVAGSAAIGYGLVDAIADREGLPASSGPGPWSWLGDALGPDAAVREAIGNTLVLGSVAVAVGLVSGAIGGGLLRLGRRQIGRWAEPRGGVVAAVALAVALPGVALLPVARWIVDAGWAPDRPVTLAESFGDGLRFVTLWGALAGLAVAPTVASAVAGAGATSGHGPAQWLAAARPLPGTRWRVGVPTTALLLAVAAAELLSGHRGLFGAFARALGDTADGGPDLATASSILIWVAIGGAILVPVLELVGALAGDNGGGGGGGGALAATTTIRSRWTLPLLGLVAALTVAAGLARLLVGTGADAAALAEPRLGGPWLGTDDAGRDNLGVALAALWPTGLLAAGTAALAALLGQPVAWLRARAPRPLARLVAIVVDVTWWPTPLVLALAVVALDRPARPEQSLSLIALGGLALTPAASRFLAAGAGPGAGRRLLAATAAYLWGLALAVQVVVGLAGFGGRSGVGDLGTALGRGLELYDRTPWPYLVPAVTAAVAVGALLGLGSSLVVPERSAPAASADPMDPRDATEQLPVAPTPPGADPEPAVAAVADAADPDRPASPATPGDDLVVAESEVPAVIDLRDHPDDRLVPGATGSADQADPSTPDPEQPAPAAEGAPVSTAHPDRSEEADGDDAESGTGGFDILEAATKTVELRPSTLRRAGVEPSPEPNRPVELSSGWSRPVLADRPPAAVASAGPDQSPEPGSGAGDQPPAGDPVGTGRPDRPPGNETVQALETADTVDDPEDPEDPETDGADSETDGADPDATETGGTGRRPRGPRDRRRSRDRRGRRRTAGARRGRGGPGLTGSTHM